MISAVTVTLSGLGDLGLMLNQNASLSWQQSRLKSQDKKNLMYGLKFF